MIDFKEKLDIIIDKYMDLMTKTLEDEKIRDIKPMISKLKILIGLRDSFKEKSDHTDMLMLMQIMNLMKEKKNK